MADLHKDETASALLGLCYNESTHAEAHAKMQGAAAERETQSMKLA